MANAWASAFGPLGKWAVDSLKKGGDGQSVPQAPSTQDEVNAWLNSLGQIYQAQIQYQLPMAQAQKSAMEALYPTTAGLQENLAKQSQEGMASGVPDWMKQQYQSNTNAQLGANAGSPIGADYMSRGLLQQQQDWRQYYQNMAFQLAGRQPLATPGLDYMSQFTPGQVMQGMNQNYATSGDIYGKQLGYNTAAADRTQKYVGMGMNMAGALASGGMGGGMGGFGGYGSYGRGMGTY